MPGISPCALPHHRFAAAGAARWATRTPLTPDFIDGKPVNPDTRQKKLCEKYLARPRFTGDSFSFVEIWRDTRSE
jgi:hypothetical protein